MKKLRRYRIRGPASWLAGLLAAAVLAACANGPFGPLEPVPGNGPGGKPMPTSTDIAVGSARDPTTQLVYPITARVDVSDNYHGKTVEDPYRWLEDLNSKPTRDWVAAQNKAVAAAARGDSASRVGEGAADEVVELRALQYAGERRRPLLLPAQRRQARIRVFCSLPIVSMSPAGCSSIPIRCARMRPWPWRISRRARRATWSRTRSPMAAPIGRSGDSVAWRMAPILTDVLRFTKFWGVSWARDGSGVYYSRYPALPNGKGDDAARPAVYFHKLGEPQESDRLVYAVTDHPTRVPSVRVTEDGHYLVITLFDGYDRNGVSLLDLRQPERQSHSALLRLGRALYVHRREWRSPLFPYDEGCTAAPRYRGRCP